MNHHEVQARLAILDKQFKTAESIYLDYNNLGAAMEMYQELHKWDEGRFQLLHILFVSGYVVTKFKQLLNMENKLFSLPRFCFFYV